MTEIGLESTVVDCTSDVPLVLRSGAVTLEQLQEIIPETRAYKLQKDETPKSPGLKHRHYSPQAKVRLVSNSKFQVPSLSAAFIGLNEPDAEFELEKICASVEDYAHEVFAFFRQCDAQKIETIYCEKVEEKGIGLALMDRLGRAAEI